MSSTLRLSAVLTLIGLLSCTGPDPSAIVFKPRTPSSSGGTPSSSGNLPTGSGGGGGGGDGGTAGADGGGGSADGGGGGTAPSGASAPGPTAYAAAEVANPHAPIGSVTPALDQNQACGGCHAGPSPRKLLASGVVYVKADRAARANNYEIWIIEKVSGKRHKTNSGANGGFWFGEGSPGSPTAIAFPAYTAVRAPDGKVVPMMDEITNGNCNTAGCHNAIPLAGSK